MNHHIPPVPPIPREYSSSKIAQPRRLYSAPTTAKSSFTASASVGDLSQPTRVSRFSRTNPNRLPTPINGERRVGGFSKSASAANVNGFSRSNEVPRSDKYRRPNKSPSRIPTPVSARTRVLSTPAKYNQGSKAIISSPRRYISSQATKDIPDDTPLPKKPSPGRSFHALRKISSKRAILEDTKSLSVEEYQKHATRIPSSMSDANPSLGARSTPRHQRSLFSLRKTPTGTQTSVQSSKSIPDANTPRLQSSFFYLSKTPTKIPTSNLSFTPKIGQNHASISNRVNIPQVSAGLPTPVPTSAGARRSFFQPKKLKFENSYVPQSTLRQKENVPPARAHRLLGPVSPFGANKSRPPRSRTMGMLSSITATFSTFGQTRSTSTNSLLQGKPTTAIDAAVIESIDLYKPSHRHVRVAQLDQYWCGRVQALSDLFQLDEFKEALLDKSSYDAIRSNKELPRTPAFDAEAWTETGFEPYEPMTFGVAFLKAAEEMRLQRIFIHLSALCVTPEAKKSLTNFQHKFARIKKNDKLLPKGYRMEKEREGWVSRLSRVVTPASGGSTSMGRKRL